MNIVVMTKGEWQAFGLVIELLRQKSPADRLVVWDDFSPSDWVEQMSDIAEVKQDALADNFGEHRNRVKELFDENDWVLMLDADEWIQPGFIAALQAHIGEHQFDACFLERKTTYWDATGSVLPPAIDYAIPFDPDYQGRVFLNLPSIRYRGPVHEVLEGWAWPLHLKGAPLTIIHHHKRCERRYAHLVKAS